MRALQQLLKILKTDASITPIIETIKDLRYLNLSYCGKITDDFLGNVGVEENLKLPPLEFLDLSGCHKISDAGLRRISETP